MDLCAIDRLDSDQLTYLESLFEEMRVGDAANWRTYMNAYLEFAQGSREKPFDEARFSQLVDSAKVLAERTTEPTSRKNVVSIFHTTMLWLKDNEKITMSLQQRKSVYEAMKVFGDLFSGEPPVELKDYGWTEQTE